jgi:hypothetical protein
MRDVSSENVASAKVQYETRQRGMAARGERATRPDGTRQPTHSAAFREGATARWVSNVVLAEVVAGALALVATSSDEAPGGASGGDDQSWTFPVSRPDARACAVAVAALQQPPPPLLEYQMTIRVGDKVLLVAEAPGWAGESSSLPAPPAEAKGEGRVLSFVAGRGGVCRVKWASGVWPVRADELTRPPRSFHAPADVKRRFRAAVAASEGGADALSRGLPLREFQALLPRLLRESGATEHLPSDADLAEAFYGADRDGTGYVDMFEFRTLYARAQAGGLYSLGLGLQRDHALSTDRVLDRASADWHARVAQQQVPLSPDRAPTFAATDARASARASKGGAALADADAPVSPSGLSGGGSGTSGGGGGGGSSGSAASQADFLRAQLLANNLADARSLKLLKRLSVASALHLQLVTMAQLTEAGFNRIQARRLLAIGKTCCGGPAADGPARQAASPGDRSHAAGPQQARPVGAGQYEADLTPYAYNSRRATAEALRREKAAFLARTANGSVTVPTSPLFTPTSADPDGTGGVAQPPKLLSGLDEGAGGLNGPPQGSGPRYVVSFAVTLRDKSLADFGAAPQASLLAATCELLELGDARQLQVVSAAAGSVVVGLEATATGRGARAAKGAAALAARVAGDPRPLHGGLEAALQRAGLGKCAVSKPVVLSFEEGREVAAVLSGAQVRKLAAATAAAAAKAAGGEFKSQKQTFASFFTYSSRTQTARKLAAEKATFASRRAKEAKAAAKAAENPAAANAKAQQAWHLNVFRNSAARAATRQARAAEAGTVATPDARGSGVDDRGRAAAERSTFAQRDVGRKATHAKLALERELFEARLELEAQQPKGVAFDVTLEDHVDLAAIDAAAQAAFVAAAATALGVGSAQVRVASLLSGAGDAVVAAVRITGLADAAAFAAVAAAASDPLQLAAALELRCKGLGRCRVSPPVALAGTHAQGFSFKAGDARIARRADARKEFRVVDARGAGVDERGRTELERGRSAQLDVGRKVAHAQLTAEREAYEGRVARGDGRTVASDRGQVHSEARVEARVQRELAADPAAYALKTTPQGGHRINSSDLATFNRSLRRASHEELAAAKVEWEARPHDDEGHFLPTVPQTFTFLSDERAMRKGDPLPPATSHSIGKEDVAAHSSWAGAARRREQGREETLAAFEARLDADGLVPTTVATQPNLSVTKIEAKPPTVYKDAVTRLDVEKFYAGAKYRESLVDELLKGKIAFCKRRGLPAPQLPKHDPEAFGRRSVAARSVSRSNSLRVSGSLERGSSAGTRRGSSGSRLKTGEESDAEVGSTYGSEGGSESDDEGDRGVVTHL